VIADSLLGYVADDILSLDIVLNQMARQFWSTIKSLFQANNAPRAVFLSHEFYSMTQGDLSINE
jgi:hypothetical protein